MLAKVMLNSGILAKRRRRSLPVGGRAHIMTDKKLLVQAAAALDRRHGPANKRKLVLTVEDLEHEQHCTVTGCCCGEDQTEPDQPTPSGVLPFSPQEQAILACTEDWASARDIAESLGRLTPKGQPPPSLYEILNNLVFRKALEDGPAGYRRTF